MLIFLLPDASQKSVLNVFDKLTLLLGLDTFRKLFPVILTDNGTEFKGAHNLEFTQNGARRTRLFYCDPQASWQKAHVEKNHVLIRRILPKGTTFKFLSDEDVHLICCHINSVARELFDNRTPFELMQKEELKKLPEGKYNENGYKASATKKITFKYNDEVAIKNYIKSKGLSDDYLVTEIRTSKFNDELKKEGMLFESLKPYIVKNESYSLNVSKEAK